MRRAAILILPGLALLAACGSEADEPAAPASPQTSTPAAAHSVADPLQHWLVGSWSYSDSCETDFAVHYEADGTLDNYGQRGTWVVVGEEVNETVTEQWEMGDDAPIAIDPPITNTYRIERIDETHAAIHFDGERFELLRCE